MRTQPLHVVSCRLFLTVSIYEGGRRSETEPSRVILLCVKPPRVKPCRVIVDTLSSRLCPRALLPVLDTRQNTLAAGALDKKLSSCTAWYCQKKTYIRWKRTLPVVCEDDPFALGLAMK